MRETTQGSNKKHYTYKVTRRRLDDPVELDNGVTFDYEVIARKAHHKKKSKNCRHQSAGRLRRHSRKRNYHMSDVDKNVIFDVDYGLSSSKVRRLPQSVSQQKVADFMKKWKKSRKPKHSRKSKRKHSRKSKRRICPGKSKKACKRLRKVCKWKHGKIQKGRSRCQKSS